MNNSSNSYHVHMEAGSQSYDIDLTRTDRPETIAVVIDGRGYALSGDQEITSWVKNRLNKLSSTKFDNIESFRAVLLGNKGEVQKIQKVAIEKLGSEEAYSKQKAVENGIIPRLGKKGLVNKVVSIEERMRELGIRDCSITVLNGAEIWSKNYGEHANQNRLFQAASCSKTVAALTVLTLVDEGKLGLDDDVSKILPKELWKLIDPENLTKNKNHKVTVHRLLSHTAGTTVGGFSGYAKDEVKKPSSVDDILTGKSTNSDPVRVVNLPGTEFEYSGGGTTILQKVVEVVTGQTFADAAKERVLEKLGMKSSTYFPKGIKPMKGYEIDGKEVEGGFHIYPEHAAAGLWTTSEDLAQLIVGIQESLKGTEGSSLISQDLAREMLTPQNKGLPKGPNGEDPPNGLGVMVDIVDGLPQSIVFSHAGQNKGFRCVFVGNNKDQGVVIMTNSDNGEHLWKEVLTAVAKEYDWPEKNHLMMNQPELDTKEINPPTDIKKWGEKRAGTYHIQNPEEKVAVKISTEGEKVFAQITGEKRFEIFPLSDSIASYRRFDKGPWEIISFKDQYLEFIGSRWGPEITGKFAQRDNELLKERVSLVAEGYWEKYILKGVEKDHSGLKGFLVNTSEDPIALESKFDKAIKKKNFQEFLSCFQHLKSDQVFQINGAEHLDAIPLPSIIQSESSLSADDINDIRDCMRDQGFSGVIAISDGKEVHTLKSKSIESEKTPFAIHSVAKAFTGVLALKLVQDGTIPKDALKEPIQLDKSVIEALPKAVQEQLKNTPLGEVMLHRGRYGDYTENYQRAIREALEKGEDPPKIEKPEDLLKFADKDLVPEEELDETGAKYSNLGILLVGLSLQHLYKQKHKVSKSYDELLREYIIEPAKLTTFSPTKPENATFNPKDKAAPYIFGTPSGGYWTTAEDLLKFGKWINDACKDTTFKSLVEKHGGEFFEEKEQKIIHEGKWSISGGEETASSAMLTSYLGNKYTIAIVSNQGYFASDKLDGAIRYHILSKRR